MIHSPVKLPLPLHLSLTKGRERIRDNRPSYINKDHGGPFDAHCNTYLCHFNMMNIFYILISFLHCSKLPFGLCWCHHRDIGKDVFRCAKITWDRRTEKKRKVIREKSEKNKERKKQRKEGEKKKRSKEKKKKIEKKRKEEKGKTKKKKKKKESKIWILNRGIELTFI